LLQSVPGVAWILGYTIASEIGDISRFASPKQLVGYTGLCPRVIQSGEKDWRGPLAKNGPKYLRWALIEAAVHAARHPVYAEHYQRTKTRLGRQRGANVARVGSGTQAHRGHLAHAQTGSFFSPARSHCVSGRA
jgi:transposase